MPSDLANEPSGRPKNRRAAIRYRFYANIEIDWGSTVVWGKVRDISREGMFIEIADTPWVHSQFTARLAFDVPLPIWCVVRRVVPGQGIGVAIVIVNREARQRFNALLRALRIARGSVVERESSSLSSEALDPVSASRDQ